MTSEEQECGHLCGLEAVHSWFGLTYANYLVLPRSILQSMPEEWQSRFVQCLEELQVAADDIKQPYSYNVSVRDEDGKFARDPVPHYDRGRTKVELQPVNMRHVRLPIVEDNGGRTAASH